MVSRRRFLRAAAAASLVGCGGTAPAARTARPRIAEPDSAGRPSEAWLDAFREAFREEARALAAAPYVPPRRELPAPLDGLDYDAYRSIRYRPDRALWREAELPFQAQLFHLGFAFREPVEVAELGPSGSTRLAFDASRFEYPPGVDSARIPSDLGYAGLRIHAPINRPDYFDEVIVLQGASYFRAVGRDQVYGLSARGLAIDTGEANVTEEFPRFDAIHLVRPEPGDTRMRMFARLTSPRAAGAYELVVEPGAPTTITVSAHVFLRERPSVIGLAPLTSMYLFGEDRPARFGDFRPEVHDSDGLAMHGASGERIWRPLRNPPSTTVTEHRLDDPRGFGLLQRDRAHASYLDLEARYERRPSAWIEPIGDWGRGRVRLLEIATELETDDNIAMLWVPDEVEGDELSFSYRLHIGDRVTDAPPTGQVASTRIGSRATIGAPVREEGPRFVIDWGGEDLREHPETLELVATARGGTVVRTRVEPDPELGVVRSTFDVAPETDAIELRAFLRRGDRAVSETWSYLWQPSPS